MIKAVTREQPDARDVEGSVGVGAGASVPPVGAVPSQLRPVPTNQKLNPVTWGFL